MIVWIAVLKNWIINGNYLYFNDGPMCMLESKHEVKGNMVIPISFRAYICWHTGSNHGNLAIIYFKAIPVEVSLAMVK